MSPTKRSLKLLRDLGASAQVVERWNPFAHIRQDLFGWIDIVAVHPKEPGVLGVQTTTNEHAGERLSKAKGNPALIAWLLAGGKLQFHGWRKLKGRWTVNARDITMDDLTSSEVSGE